MDQLDGFVFTKKELLVLLDVVSASYLVGIDQNQLRISSREEHEAVVRDGIASLIERDMMRIEEDHHILNPTLLSIAGIIARPEVVSIATRTELDGTRRFTWYQNGYGTVEFTQPTPDQYRFAIIPNATALVSRIQFLLPSPEETGAEINQFMLPKAAFFELNNLVQQSEGEKAFETLTDAGAPVEVAERLLSNMQQPVYSGNLTIMRMNGPEIIDGKDIAILCGQDNAWTVTPMDNDPEMFDCRTFTSHSFGLIVFDAFMHLTKPEAV